MCLNLLGLIYLKGLGVEVDYTKAVGYFSKAEEIFLKVFTEGCIFPPSKWDMYALLMPNVLENSLWDNFLSFLASFTTLANWEYGGFSPAMFGLIILSTPAAP